VGDAVSVSVTQRTVLDCEIEGRHFLLEVRVRDIGATIGTEILDDESARIVAYRSGTRYSDRAEEIAREHVRESLTRVAADPERRSAYLPDLVRAHLAEVVAAEQPWTPDEEDEEW
jgi:hypothetical protein